MYYQYVILNYQSALLAPYFSPSGSERIKGGALGGSQAQGEHFKEAVHINQSLTTLGRVIMELVEAQRGVNGRPGSQQQLQQGARHIPYRDSRLTFLLQVGMGRC